MKSNIKNIRQMVTLSLLSAIILLMAFTPVGYLKIGVIEITFLVIPVAVGAITTGPLGGAILGGVFGITSFIQALGLSAFGATLLAINPIYTFIVCIVPRVLCGFLCGLIYRSLSKVDKTKIVSHAVASFSCAVFNTVFFIGALLLLFSNTDYIQSMRGSMNILAFAAAFVGVNGLIEAGVCFVVATAVAKAVTTFTERAR